MKKMESSLSTTMTNQNRRNHRGRKRPGPEEPQPTDDYGVSFAGHVPWRDSHENQTRQRIRDEDMKVKQMANSSATGHDDIESLYRQQQVFLEQHGLSGIEDDVMNVIDTIEKHHIHKTTNYVSGNAHHYKPGYSSSPYYSPTKDDGKKKATVVAIPSSSNSMRRGSPGLDSVAMGRGSPTPPGRLVRQSSGGLDSSRLMSSSARVGAFNVEGRGSLMPSSPPRSYNDHALDEEHPTIHAELVSNEISEEQRQRLRMELRDEVRAELQNHVINAQAVARVDDMESSNNVEMGTPPPDMAPEAPVEDHTDEKSAPFWATPKWCIVIVALAIAITVGAVVAAVVATTAGNNSPSAAEQESGSNVGSGGLDTPSPTVSPAPTFVGETFSPTLTLTLFPTASPSASLQPTQTGATRSPTPLPTTSPPTPSPTWRPTRQPTTPRPTDDDIKPTSRPTPRPTDFKPTLRPTPRPTDKVLGGVTRFELWDADRDRLIRNMRNNDIISRKDVGNVNIRAVTEGSFRSVVFAFDRDDRFQVEDNEPWALFGDDGGDYHAWDPVVGDHTVKATPYTRKDGQGSAGDSLEISFSVVEGDNPTPRPSPAPSNRPTLTPVPPPTPPPSNPPIPGPTLPPTPPPTMEATPPPTLPNPTPFPTLPPTLAPIPEPTPPPPVADPTPPPVPEPTLAPIPEPTPPPTPGPTAQPVPEPTAPPAPEPTTQPVPEPTAPPAPEPTTQPLPEPTPVPATDPPETDSPTAERRER